MSIRVALAVHAFHPHIGGSEAHVRRMAMSLRERGFVPLVVTPRAFGDPMSVDGIEITGTASDVLGCDVVLTYSASRMTLDVGGVLTAAGARRPRWIVSMWFQPLSVSRHAHQS